MAEVRFIEGYGYMQKSTKTLQNVATTTTIIADALSLANWNNILEYQIPKRTFIQLKRGAENDNQIWMELKDTVPAVLAPTDKVRVIKADPDGNYISTIWEGLYNDFVTAVSGNKASREFKQYPQNDARLNEAMKLIVQVDSAAQLVIIANSTIQIAHEYWIPARE